MKKSLLSLAVFAIAIAAFTQTITVTSPNGGETWAGCSVHPITWTHSGTSGFFNVEYSTDNGSTWAVLASNYQQALSPGSFSWTVPNVNTVNALVRVYQNGNPAVTDQSNIVYTITPALQITAPNGGESWQVANPSTQNITWTAAGTSGFYSIDYSTNAGSTWTNIVTNMNIPTNSYTWTIPNTPSASCLVRVLDFQSSSCKTDNSDALFTIAAPTPVITVTAPNGGNTLYVGQSSTITWTSAYLSGSFVKIEYSTDNGAIWSTIVASVTNSGSYTWNNIPNTPSTQCLVKVSDAGNLATNDVSNAVFTIALGTLTVTAPNGGESWISCSVQSVTWTRTGTSNFFNVYYSINGGTTWQTLATNYNCIGGSCSFSWTLNNTTTTQARVLVTDYNNSVIRDSSDLNFTILPAVTITSPNGSESWVGGSSHPITWTQAAGASNWWTIQYSTNAGFTWNTIVSNVNIINGTYNWSVPNIPSTQCLVRVYDFNNSCKIDQSDNLFTITAAVPVITVVSPNGGNIYYVGGSYNITWSYQYVVGSFVTIEYSTNNGSTWSTIIGSTSISTGSYTWTPVPNIPSATCLVRVSEFGNAAVNDVSNAVFNIVYPYVTVTAPNGAESWNGCFSYNITWTPFQYGSSNWKVEYSLNNGTNWNTIVSSTASTSYSWTIPDTSSIQTLVRVTKTTDTLVTDVSNAVFTINADNSIIVTAPNGGESWQVANPNTQNITWTYDIAKAGPYFYLYYSTNGGTSWTILNAGNYVTQPGGNGTFAWTIPNTPSTNVLVRIDDYYTSCKTDKSNAVFTITAPNPVITVTSPNGGNIYYVGGSYNITWTYQYVASSFATIEYSVNNGTSWTTIATSTSLTTGSYTWTPVPNFPSTQCLIRVSEYLNPTVNDVSNAVFNIVYPYVTVTSPNTAVTWNGCTSQNITWNYFGTGSPNWKVQYSTDNGTNWTLLSNVTGTSYNWNPIPNTITSTQALVRVTNNADSIVTDQSDVNFNITPVIHIIVNSPNGGENFQVGNPATQTITWAYSPTVSGPYFYLYLSTNGGTSWTILNGGNYVTGSAGNGSYNWTIPNTPSTNCLIRIDDYYSTCKTDVSNAPFTITAPTPVITVNSPNGGNTYYVGGSYNITWSYQYVTGSFVQIDYSVNNGMSWLPVIASTSITTGSYFWTPIPNNPSTQCLVRVRSTSDTTIVDSSNAVFNIVYPYVIVNAPNGGDSALGCNSYNISWTPFQYGSSNWKVEYSLNNGTTWNNIISSTAATSYNWTVPDSSSSQALVRVTKTTDALVTDSSNAVFTVVPDNSITITSPNGGENWQVGGGTQNITWTYNTGLAGPYFYLYYSTNGGTSWTALNGGTYVTQPGGVGSYTWTIPNTPSANCLVRIDDYYNSCRTDKSDSLFAISTPTPVITVTSPNGGNIYYVGGTYNITWSYQFVAGSFVKIEYSTNNGTSWTTITNSTAISTGSYTWTNVPNTPGTQCLVKVSEYLNPSVKDSSNAVFNIVYPYVVVTAPNGGESWNGCFSYNITWTPFQYGSSNWKVEYSLNSGTNWNTLISSTAATTYSWTIPDTSSTQALVRVTKTTDTLVTDASNAVFTVNADNSIIVTSPNSGENWQVANPATQNITWSYDIAKAGPYFYLYYSTNGGVSWTALNGGTYVTQPGGNGTFAWTIPNTPSTNVLVRIDDYYTACKTDKSDTVFTITAPTPVITVVSPNGGNILYVGNIYTVSWSYQYVQSSFVKLEYSTDNGGSWNTITNSTAIASSYSWTVPNTPSTLCLVRVSEFGNPSVNDVSNAVFSIVSPYITVSAPNGGEIWNGCTNQTITWTGFGTSGPYMVEYSNDNGVNWTTLVGSTAFSSYTWTPVPNTQQNSSLVRVSVVSNSSVNDVSNAVFTVSQQTYIIVNVPNGGESWQVNNPATQTINWAYANTNSYFDIYVSYNGGTTWTLIGNDIFASAGNGNFVWTVANNPSTNCLIRVEDYLSSCKTDKSDAPFTIVAPTPYITVLNPNGGNTLYSYNGYNITWNSAYLSSSFVRIDYSLDSGATWISIITSTSNTGSYSWTIPNVNSTKCLIRISDFGNSATYDKSDAVFTIKPAVVVTAPNGAENLSGCAVTTITWTGESTSGNYQLQYSLNGGSTWTTIVSQAFSGGPNFSYNWTLPNTPSDFCLVKVTNTANTLKVDQSNAVFSILPTITVTNPNNGGSFAVGSTLNITWTQQGVSNFYNIDYSTNGGVSWTNIVFNTSIITNTYAWIVPNFPSTNCLVKVSDFQAACKIDQSDLPFTIATAPAAVTVSSPNGGENWTVCSTKNITWSANGTSGVYVIEYSSNLGTSWTTLSAGYTTNNGTYSWTLPSVATTQGLIRVTDSVTVSLVDQSNAAFTISALATPGAITGATTACQGSTQTYSVALVTGATSYTWTLPSGWTGTSTSNTINATVGATGGSVQVLANNSCASSANSTLTVTATPLPATPGAITGNTTPCSGISQTYSITAVSGATSYTWILPVGYSGSSTTTSIGVLIGSGAGDILVSANNNCGSSSLASLTITPSGSSLPNQPGNISGVTSPCVASSQSYSIAAVAGATSYTWSLPVGWTGTSTTNSITATVGTAGGTITVTANNACGTSVAQTLAVGITNVPAQPGTISGTTSVCQNSTNTYSITAVSGASNYTWTLPAGWSGASTNTSIVTVASGTTGTISVTANNSCGSSIVRTLTVTVNTPVTPTIAITATPSGTQCANTSITFTATQTNGGTPTYQWYKNGTAVGLNAVSYTAATWADGDSVWVVMTTSLTCVTGNAATSNKIVLSITPTVTPTISVSADATSICSGQTVNFTSTITNGGTTPTYQWRKNGVNIAGATSSVYSTSTAINGDAFTCVLTSNAPCASPVSATSNSVSITVSSSVAASLTISALPSGAVCAGTPVTYTSVITNGGTTPAYQWTLNSANITGANSSTYTEPNPINGDTIRCVMTSSLTCVTSSPATSNSIVMTVNSLPATPAITAGGPLVFCTGDSVTLTSSSATGNSWQPGGQTTQAITVTAAGSYTVKVTNGSNCTSTSAATNVTVNPNPTVTLTHTNVTCTGDSNGTSSAAVASGTNPYTYLWSNGATTSSISNLQATVYYITVTDANSCTSSSSDTIGITTNIIASDTLEYCKTSTYYVKLSATPSGGIWSASAGVVLIAPDTLDVRNTPWTVVSGTPHTLTYTVNGCSKNIALIVTGAQAGNDTSVCVNNGIFNLQTPAPSGGIWSSIGSGGLIDTNTGQINPTGLNGLVSYLYTHTGCADTMVVTYRAVAVTMSSTNASCSPGSDGTATAAVSGGNTPYTYLWSPSVATTSSVTGLSAATYFVTVSDNGGCSKNDSAVVTGIAAPVTGVSPTNPAFCQGDSVTLLAYGATSYSWSPATGLSSTTISNPVATPTATTQYTVYGTSGGCVDSANVTVTVNLLPAQPTISTSGPTNFCQGDSVVLTSSAISGNVWTGGATTSSITVLSSGTYSTTVTDANGCKAVSAATSVNVTAKPVVTASGATTFCQGDSVVLTSSVATNNTWSPGGQTTQSITVTSGGSYSVSVNDSVCSSSSNVVTVVVNPLPSPVITASGSTSFCQGGSVNLTSSATSGNLWSNASTTQMINVTLSGTYSVTQTDTNGCSASSSSVTVTVFALPPTPVITPSGTVAICPGDSVTLTSSSATGNLWSNLKTTQSITVNSGGSFSVTVTDGNGCSTSSAQVVTFVDTTVITPTITVSGPTTFCSGGSVTLTSSSTTNNLWSPGNQTTQSINVTSGGTYSVKTTNVNGCTATSSSVSVTVNPAPPANAGADVTIAPGDSTQLNASGGVTYNWSPAGSLSNAAIANPFAKPSATTTYTVTVTNTNGCTKTDSVVVTVSAPLNYCIPTSTSGPTLDDYINGVSLLSINNQNTGSPTGPFYNNYTSLSATIKRDSTYSVAITSGGFSPDDYAAWIDFNKDGDFFDIGEKLGQFATTAIFQTKTISFTVPATATLGTTRMRVRCAYNTVSIDPCSTSTYGEIEDYSVLIQQGCNLSVAATATGTSCSVNNGTVTAAASAGTSPYTYLWSGGQTTSAISGLGAATYSVTVTDAISCSVNLSATVTSSGITSPVVTAGGATTFCTGGNVVLTADTSAGIVWSPGGQTTQSITVSTSGTYSVTKTNSSGCSASSNLVTVTVNSLPPTPIITPGGTVQVCQGSTATLTSSSTTGNVWSPGNQTTQSITVSVAGTYKVTVTDANGCTATSDSVTVVVNSLPVANAGIDTVVILGDSTQLIATGGVTYSWNPSAGLSDSTVANPYSKPSVTTAYKVVVTDAKGCTASDTVVVTVVLPGGYCLPTYTTGTSDSDFVNGVLLLGINNQNTGSPTGPYYNDYTSLSASIKIDSAYSLFVTGGTYATDDYAAWIDYNKDGDFSDSTEKLGQFKTTLANETDTIMFTVPSTALTGQTRMRVRCAFNAASMDPCNTYGWGEVEDYTIFISTSSCSAITLTTSSTNAACGVSDGSATVTPGSGISPYSYMWSNSKTTATVTGLAAGNYSVTVTDAGGCSGTATVAVNNTSAPSATASSTNVSCNGQTNGTAAVAAAGGSTPYTYLWSNAATTTSISGLIAGNYSVTVTGSNGCKASASVTVTQPTAITVAATSTNVSCNGGADGTVAAAAAGGSSPYSYSWSGGGTSPTKTGLAAGTYTVTVTDANGCTKTGSSTVTQPTAVTVTATATNVSCNGGADGTLAAAVAGGSLPYSYSWSGGGTSPTKTGLAAGTYTVTVTDANGCTKTAGATVTQPTAVTVTATTTNVSCNGGTDGTATAAVAGGSSPYSYSWSGGGTSPTKTGLAAGTYTVTVTDANGCTKTAGANVSQPATLTVSITTTPSSQTLPNCNGTAAATAAGGSSPYTYLWSNGQTGATTTGLCAAAYTVTVTDAKGCTTTGSANIIFVGIEELSVGEYMTIYPNPSRGAITAEFSATNSTLVQLRILNTIGQVVHSETIGQVIGKVRKEILLTGLPSGVYYLKVVQDDAVGVRKLIIE